MLNFLKTKTIVYSYLVSLLRGKGLELRSALQLRGKAEAKELPSPLTIPQPLRRERWRHSFADAKRRWVFKFANLRLL